MSKGQRTRHSILLTAFDLMYRNGYRATSVDDILKKMDVTKGSFFYHFKSKEEMALAVIDEIMYPGMKRIMIDPLICGDDPRDELYSMMKGLLTADDLFVVDYGCPVVNLVEEMAPIHKGFNRALQKITNAWQKAIEACVEKGIEKGCFEIADPGKVSIYIVSGYAGIRNLGKIHGSIVYMDFLGEYKRYLDAL